MLLQDGISANIAFTPDPLHAVEFGVGTCATWPYEPRQAREGAAVSRSPCVPQTSLAPAQLHGGDMAYQVLARKWRPTTFKDLVGQEHISKTLINAIKMGRIAHAYLFSGIRGVGKTTVARILARSLNCQQGPTPEPCLECQSCREIGEGVSPDVIEIDGASNTGIDNIRDLQEKAMYAPLRGRYKIYIIDEIHMLSTAAFNALLKILEEPPPHIIFIFATTEPHKIPATIHSRCQHLQFRRMGYREIMNRLEWILHQEGIEYDVEGLALIGRLAEGSMRDALSLLDQVISYTGGNISRQEIESILGLADMKIEPFVDSIIQKDPRSAFNELYEVINGGYDLKQFCLGVIEYFRNMLLIKLGLFERIDLPEDKKKALASKVDVIPVESIHRWARIFQETLEELRWFPYPQFSLEMATIRATHLRPVKSIEEIMESLKRIEKNMEGHDTPEKGEPPSPVHEKISCESSSRDNVHKDTPMELPDVEGLWSSIIEKIVEIRPPVGSYLQHGRIGRIEDNILVIEFPQKHRAFRDLIDRDGHRDLILRVIKEFIPPVKDVRFTIATSPDGMATYGPARRKEVEDAFQDDKTRTIVQQALEILGGELIELRPVKSEKGEV